MTNESQNIQQDGRSLQNGKEDCGSEGQSSQGPCETVAEEWRPVVGYEGFYEVSNLGHMRGLPRTLNYKDGRTVYLPLRTLTPSPTGKYASIGRGYLAVKLCVNYKSTLLKVHRAVAIAFIANPRLLPHINHLDGNTLNNNTSNLEWITNGDNIRHASRNGLLRPQRGESCATHKLSTQQVMEMRLLYVQGHVGYRHLAALFGIEKTQVYRILKRKSWTHV